MRVSCIDLLSHGLGGERPRALWVIGTGQSKQGGWKQPQQKKPTGFCAYLALTLSSILGRGMWKMWGIGGHWESSEELCAGAEEGNLDSGCTVRGRSSSNSLWV